MPYQNIDPTFGKQSKTYLVSILSQMFHQCKLILFIMI